MEVVLPVPGSVPIGITTGFGAVWFAELGSQQIGRLDPQTLALQEFGPVSGAFGVTTGFGKVWFTGGPNYNIVGQLDPQSGEFVEFATPTQDSYPVEITVGNGAVWFTEISANQVGRLNVHNGTITEFMSPKPNSSPFGITSGPKGIWFTLFTGDAIGLIKP
jgi:virginiamycin B lyase